MAEAQSGLARQRQDWVALAAGDLAAAQAEFAARRSALPALAERVERTVVRAPLPGRINRVLVTTVGGVAAPGADRDQLFAAYGIDAPAIHGAMTTNTITTGGV